MKVALRMPVVGLLAMTAAAAGQARLGTVFTYQGELLEGGAPAEGLIDFRFTLFDSLGVRAGPTLCADNVSVAGGRFTVELDFGAQFAGEERLLEVSVRPDAGLNCTNTTGFTLLAPRQRLTAAPHAVYSIGAGDAGRLNGQPPAFYTDAGNLSAGVLPGARLAGVYAQPLTLSSPANVLAGNGAAVTALNAANVTAGTLADARLSANIPRLSAANTFTAGTVFLGTVGIGTAAAEDLLHLFAGSAGTVLANGNARLVIEDDSAAYLNFLTPAASENGVLFGIDGSSNASGGVVFNNTANPLGLQLRTGGNATRMVIDDAGLVGIGTLAPAARLHVSENVDITGTGGGSFIVGVDAANVRMDGNEVQAFAAGAPSSLTLQANGGNLGVGTASPTGKLHVVGGTGNGSVVLPTGSISAEETGDEMGIATDIGSNVSLTAGVVRVLASRSISAPRAGFVIAIGTFDIFRTIQSGSDVIDASVGPNSTDPFAPENSRTQLAFDTTLASSTGFPVTFQGIFDVPAGSTTFHLIAEGSASPATSARNPHLTLIFVPTAYGTVEVDNP